MNWSKYNLLFRSERHGHLLYSSLSNTFARLDEETAREVETIRQDPGGYDFTKRPALYLQLVMAQVLVEPGEEKDLIQGIRLRRRFENYDTSWASLTIVPTLSCNFACTYCYQEDRRPVHMKEDVERQLLVFLEGFGKLKVLNVEWFGGEPTLRLASMCRITQGIERLGIPWDAGLVTNGFLLGEEVVSRLEELRVREIQVTIDGSAEVHDTRRVLLGGGPTYDRILRNLDGLLEKWTGRLLIRVNLDKTNRDAFFVAYRQLQERFRGKNVKVYPGFVIGSPFNAPDSDCHFDREDMCNLQIEGHRKHGIRAFGFYPEKRVGCGATSRNSYVIGPEGEVYKCYADIGKPDRIVGSIFDQTAWNYGKMATYMIGGDAFEDPECQECFFLPLCDGGCPTAWRTESQGRHEVHRCVAYKETLPEWLEIHYELKEKAAGRL